MKFSYFLFVIITLLGYNSMLFGQISITPEEIENAKTYAQNHFVLKAFLNDSTWDVIDKQGDSYLSNIGQLILTTSRSELLFCLSEGEWFLVTGPKTYIKISIPKGYDIEHIMVGDVPRTPILAPEIFRLKKMEPIEGVPKERLTRLYNPIKGEFITDFCNVSMESLPDFLITEPWSDGTTEAVSDLIDLKNNRRFIRPKKQDGNFVFYRFPGENSLVLSTHINVPGKTSDIRHDTLCDRELKPIFELPDDWVFVSPMSEGFACIRRNSGTDTEPIWEFGVVDKAGKIRFRGLASLLPFSEGLACFGQRVGPKKSDDPCDQLKYGYIDFNGVIVLPPTFDRAVNFKNGTAFVEIFARDKEQGQIFQIDNTGRKLCEIKRWTQWLYTLRKGVVLSVTGTMPGLYDFDDNNLWHADSVQNVHDLVNWGLYGFPD